MAEAELLLVKRQLAEKTREFDAVVAEWEALNEQACATEALLQRQSELLGKALDTAAVDAPGEARKTERRAAERVQRQGEAMDVCAALALRQQAELQSAKQHIVSQTQRLASSADLTVALLDEFKGERAAISANQQRAVARLEAQCAQLDEARACVDGLRAAHAAHTAAASDSRADYEAAMAQRIRQQVAAMDKLEQAAQEQRDTLRAQRETIAKHEAVERELRHLLRQAEQAAAAAAEVEPVIIEPQIEPQVLEQWARVVSQAANETASLRQQLKDAKESCAREHAKRQSQNVGQASDAAATAAERLRDARRELAAERLRMRRIVEAATGVPRPTITVEFNEPGPLGLKLNAHQAEGPKVVKLNRGTQAAAKPELTVGLLLETLDGQCLVGTPYNDILQMLRNCGRPAVMTFIPESTGNFDDQLARVTGLRVDLSAEMEAAASRAHELEQTQEEVARTKSDLQAAMVEASAAEDRYNEDVASAAMQSRQKQEEIASLEQQIMAAAQRERDLTDQMSKAQQQHARLIVDLRADAEQANSHALQAADEKNRRLASELHEARQELQTATETHTAGLQSLSAANSASTAAVEHLSSHRKEIEDLQEQIKGNVAREATLQAKLEETATAMATIQASNSEMDEAAKQLMSEREMNLARVRELENTVTHEGEEAARLRGLLSDGQAAKQALQVELQTTEQQLSAVRSELDFKISQDAERQHKEDALTTAAASREHAEQIRDMQLRHEAELAKALERAAEAEASAQVERSRDSQSLSEKLVAAETERASMQAQIEQRNYEQRAIEKRLAAEEARSAALLEAVQHLGRGTASALPVGTPASGSTGSRSSSPQSPTTKVAANIAERLPATEPARVPAFGGGNAYYNPRQSSRSTSSGSSDVVRAAVADLSEGVPPTASLQAMRRRMRELEEEAKSTLHSVYSDSDARSPPPRAKRSSPEISNYSPVRAYPHDGAHSPSYFGTGRGPSASSPSHPPFRSETDAELALSSLEDRLQHQLSQLETRLGRTERALSPVPTHEQPSAAAERSVVLSSRNRAPDWGYGGGGGWPVVQQHAAATHSPQPVWPREMQLTHVSSGGDSDGGRTYGRFSDRLGDPDTIGGRTLQQQQQQQYQYHQPSSPPPSRFVGNGGGYSGSPALKSWEGTQRSAAVAPGGPRSGSKSREAALRSVTAIAQRYAMDYS